MNKWDREMDSGIKGLTGGWRDGQVDGEMDRWMVVVEECVVGW